MKDTNSTPPFKSLGSHLKYLRENSSESLAEVSGAVEINEDNLERIEQGVERPSEDVLMLLISHFDMTEHEAVRLWELAGYDKNTRPDSFNFSLNDDMGSGKQPMVMLLAVDVRTQYTDGVDIALSNAGAVMTFTQAGANNKQQPVARVGMSYQQLEAVSQTIQQAMMQVRYRRPKGLPAPASDSKTAGTRRVHRRPSAPKQRGPSQGKHSQDK